MADSATSTALVIAGRYLASPAALRARPEGPIKRAWVLFEHLPEIHKDVKRIKKHLGLEDA